MPEFSVRRGVKQVCTLSVKLFGSYKDIFAHYIDAQNTKCLNCHMECTPECCHTVASDSLSDVISERFNLLTLRTVERL